MKKGNQDCALPRWAKKTLILELAESLEALMNMTFTRVNLV